VVTAGGEGGRESNGAKGKTHLCVIIHIGALLKGGGIKGCRWRSVLMGEVAHVGSARGRITFVDIFLDDELAFGKCPFPKCIVGRRTRREDVFEAATSAALVGQTTSSAGSTRVPRVHATTESSKYVEKLANR
jgi:hypothetical protein